MNITKVKNFVKENKTYIAGACCGIVIGVGGVLVGAASVAGCIGKDEFKLLNNIKRFGKDRISGRSMSDNIVRAMEGCGRTDTFKWTDELPTVAAFGKDIVDNIDTFNGLDLNDKVTGMVLFTKK